MLHEPASTTEKDYGVAYKTRLGVKLFIAYGLFYAGFIAINLYDVTLTEKIVFLGMNLATVYGFGLIVVALILAVIYTHMCTKMEKKLKAEDTASSVETGEKKEGEA